MRGSIPRLSAKFFLTRSLVVEQHTFNVQVEVFDSLRVNQVCNPKRLSNRDMTLNCKKLLAKSINSFSGCAVAKGSLACRVAPDQLRSRVTLLILRVQEVPTKILER